MPRAHACINDSKTLSQEKRGHPKLSDAIFSEPEPVDVQELNRRIATLKANPKHDDPAWWNDLAGGYLRLGQAAEAAHLLEPVTNRFANDYGVHANLGTAYHLLGRYKDAEAEIRRDLEINPEGHFGLEKYHLALLQYLSRDADYQLCHVYVDEFTPGFLSMRGMYLFAIEESVPEPTPNEEEIGRAMADIRQTLTSTNRDALNQVGVQMKTVAWKQGRPPYRAKWNLAKDPKLEEGVAYMATLNRSQPAAWVMLGVVANRGRNVNLAKAAFEKAIQLGSPQRAILQQHIEALSHFHPNRTPYYIGGLIAFVVIYCGIRITSDLRKRGTAKSGVETTV